MTTNAQRIKQLESNWDRLVAQRATHYGAVLNGLDPRVMGSALEVLNRLPQYEERFDEIEAELRTLDPDHMYLAENQDYLY